MKASRYPAVLTASARDCPVAVWIAEGRHGARELLTHNGFRTLDLLPGDVRRHLRQKEVVHTVATKRYAPSRHALDLRPIDESVDLAQVVEIDSERARQRRLQLVEGRACQTLLRANRRDDGRSRIRLLDVEQRFESYGREDVQKRGASRRFLADRRQHASQEVGKGLLPEQAAAADVAHREEHQRRQL